MTSGRKCAVITGGNAGIGFVTARGLVEQGWRVVITGRSAQKLEAAVVALGTAAGPGEATFRVGDFTRFDAVRRLAVDLLREPRIDILVNNAGIALTEKQRTPDGHDMVLQVNHLAPFLLTNLLIEKLATSGPSRIVTVSSHLHKGARSHNFEDFEFERAYSWSKSYAVTKLYNVMFTRELQRRFGGGGITAVSLHPGAIQTSLGSDGDVGGLTGFAFGILRRLVFRPIEEGARVPLFAATAPEVSAQRGAYFGTSLSAESPSPLALDDAACRTLWDLSAAATGFSQSAK